MLRFFKNLTVVEWLTLGGVTLILGSFVFDEVRARLAEYNAGVAARQDIEDENWAFRIGGKRRHWFDMTSRIFREEHDAELVHSHGCCVSCEQWRYDARYNEVMKAEIAKKIEGFSFEDAFAAADQEARALWELQRATVVRASTSEPMTP